MLARLTFIAALTASSLAMAQEPPPPPATAPEPPTAQQLATASAEADALIARSGAPGFFTNVSSDGMAKVRHQASGLVCSFVPGAENNRITVFEGGQGRRGDDVGCNADIGSVYMTYYATRYGPGYSAADSARDAAAAIHNRFPDARPYEGTFARVEPPEGVGALEYAAFLIGPADAPRYSHALTAKVGDWIFKQRLTGDGEGEAPMANLIMGGIFFNDVLRAAVDPSKP